MKREMESVEKKYEPYIPQKKIINITMDDLKNKGVKNKSK